ncbi:DUF871 domain-containing protein [Clostridium sp. D2Q-11]|uniref:DUF871 domain-containing protein n=1 Tax=Anaeromonas frigoriresistens TaxID=2683708 RepID=A0A942Z756_9FIRM|nr:MupG family TIM beta-alpha barrel fold protein [Anaeromonas frigoriresistens]MBS4536888.1 DUF871 domain-containing protein [Anaeromonas frigoriresistens]
MGKLGISIYPEKSGLEEMREYIDLATNNGFDRIFTCLLSVNKEDKDELVEKFKNINDYASSKGMMVVADVSPKVFSDLNISYKDLSFFKEIGAHGIRLDMGFTGNEESLMTFNEQGLMIEINMSNNTKYVDLIMDYMPNKEKLIGCHNFYPHNYSGLNYDHFLECTNNFKKYGLRTAAFITTQNENTFGPWPVTDGLPTLEMHRELPMDVQAKHYIALNGLIDDIIISNCYPTEDEIKKLGSLRRDLVTFDVNLVSDIPEIEEKIVLNEFHFNRGDISDNFIRSTQSRVKYKGHKFDIFNPKDIKKGDIIIESSEYGHYAGELQIALNDMKNSGKSNVVGRIKEEEIFLLDYIKPWQKFVFRRG